MDDTNRPRRPAQRLAMGNVSAGLPATDAPRNTYTRSTDARTLYLAASEPLRVTSTGEALVISRPQDPYAPAQRIPVSRILRVVCNESTEWSGAAVTLCLRRGITVTWLGSDGNAIGHAGSRLLPRTRLAVALDALSGESVTWRAGYEDWLRRQRMVVLKLWVRERAQEGHPVSEAEWQQAKKCWVYQRQVPAHLPLLLRGMVCALVNQLLLAEGLQSHYWCCADEPLMLADDLAELIWAELNLCAGSLADAVDHPREAAALFEHSTGRCSGALHVHLCSLRAHALAELAL